MRKRQDLTGQRFGRLVVLGLDHENKQAKIRWRCQCDCGNITTTQASNLRSGATLSCGCLRAEHFRNLARDITGERFGRLVGRKRDSRDRFGIAQWECDCDCGKSVIVALSSLRSGSTRSCGCLKMEVAGDAQRKPRPTAEQLRHLYWDQVLSMQKIGLLYNVSAGSVRNWLKDDGTPTRDRVRGRTDADSERVLTGTVGRAAR